MDNFNGMIYGLQVAFQPINLFSCFIGVLLGTLVGVLPGLGPLASMTILLPATLHLSPVSAIIMLAGIYYGAQYGGSTTSILVNMPGEVTSVVTCLDGYQMARKGRAGPALGIAAFGSFIAGTMCAFGLVLLAPPLARFALRFGPPEYFAVMLMGILALAYMSGKSMGKTLIMAAFGFALGSIGTDLMLGTQRFTFGIMFLSDGIGFVPAVTGMFGISEILINIESELNPTIYKGKINELFPNREDWKRSIIPIGRGTLIGFLLGAIPGGGGTISTFASYAMEKKLSKHPEEFGKGAIEGVSGPEAANNAGACGAFIPMLSLGLPFNPITALLLGSLIMYGVQPGPLMMKNHPDLFWGVISSMYVGNALLLILNLPLIPVWVQILKIPYKILFPIIILFCLIGVYSLNNSIGEVYLMILFGGIGYLFKKYDYEMAPLLLAMILAPMFEDSLRQSLVISNGSIGIFFERPIVLVIMGIILTLCVISFVIPVVKKIKIRID